MAFKTIIFLGLFCFLSHGSIAQNHNPDSVLQLVYKTLTLPEEPSLKILPNHLEAADWEALAYLDIMGPYDESKMQEAVGDVYRFKEGRFAIKMVDQKDPSKFGLLVNGEYKIVKNTLILSKENSPSFSMEIGVIYLDENYLVIDIDSLRIFLTHTHSFFPEKQD